MPALYGFPRPDYAFTAREVGLSLGGLVVHDMKGNIRPGVIGRQNIVLKASGWQVRVCQFAYVSTRQGYPVLGGLDQATTATIGTPPASGTRTDTVCYDLDAIPPVSLSSVEEGSGSPDDPDQPPASSLPVVDRVATGIVVVPGTPARATGLAANLAPLAIVNVPSSAKSINDCSISHVAAYTALVGSVVVFHDKQDMDSFKPWQGTRAYNMALDQFYSCLNPGSWRQDSGRISYKIPKWMYSNSTARHYMANAVFTLPTTISTTESIQICSEDMGSGYCKTYLRHIDQRGNGTTRIAVGFEQDANPTLPTVTFTWKVIQAR